MSQIFKCGFDPVDYLDILPDYEEYLKNDFIINQKEYNSGDTENCIWKKYIPTQSEVGSPEFRAREAKRILKTGAWIWIKEEIIWLPPSYYFALQYCPAGSVDMQFRLKRLKNVYAKLRVRKNAGTIGQLIMKSRGDGETTMEMIEALWECADGNMTTGQIGVQSKTLGDSQNPCWLYVQNTWQNLPRWIKNDLYSDFASGTNIAEKMQWMREADENSGRKGRHVTFKYYPSGTPMDGKHDMKTCYLDEICKWEECSFYDTFTNYKKFIMPGTERRGLFMMFSTPADKPCKSNEEVYSLWKDSDPNEIQSDTGTTKSRIHRYYSNPLDGIAGEYDKFGDADPNRIYDHIMRERKNIKKDKLFGEVRGYPLNEQEMFESSDSGSIWSNTKGISDRKTYLTNTQYKSPKTKEPKYVFGNLERVGGYIDGDVEFRMSDKTDFDLKEARFCFSYLPQNNEPLKNIFRPPTYVENCVGLDPFNNRYAAKDKSRQSNGAMVNRRFRDVHQTGILNCPTMIYCCRPQHVETLFEDCLMAGIFNRAMIQYENRSDKFASYAEDRGYSDWLLPEMGADPLSHRKGDAPSGGGKNAFLNAGIGLIDANTNVPLRPEDPYWLELHWFELLLESYLSFDPADTHKSDLAMADIQALVGAIKIMHKKVRTNPAFNVEVFNYHFS